MLNDPMIERAYTFYGLYAFGVQTLKETVNRVVCEKEKDDIP
jgi:hypothetical protein